jgi:sigma-54 dependent transcriptional regulator, acetoin dehydrogenase operon transcriptional activator AcoR
VIDDVAALLRPQRTGSVDASGQLEGARRVDSGNEQPVQSLKEIEREAISHALAACHFNVTRCAAILEISKPALYAKVKRYNIKLERPLH